VLSRTHPAVTGLAGHVLDTALDLNLRGPAARCGVIRTATVERRTTLLLCRYRVNLVADGRQGDHHMLADEAALLGFAGAPDNPTWLDPETITGLLSAKPSGNVAADAAHEFLGEVLTAEPIWRERLETEAHARAEAVAEAHERVRQADRRRSTGGRPRLRVNPQLPVDVVGVYVFLPGGAA
jgi:hypothetical protein